MSSGERGTLSWRNAKREAIEEDDNSDILESRGDEESIEYDEEYVEEEISEDEYEEVIVEEEGNEGSFVVQSFQEDVPEGLERQQTADLQEVVEGVAPDKLEEPTISRRIIEAWPPAENLEEQKLPEVGNIDVMEETHDDKAEIPIESPAEDETVGDSEWATFESLPTDKNMQAEALVSDQDFSVVADSLEVSEWTIFESQLTSEDIQGDAATEAQNDWGQKLFATPAKTLCVHEGSVTSSAEAPLEAVGTVVESQNFVAKGEGGGRIDVNPQSGSCEREDSITAHAPCVSQQSLDELSKIRWEQPDWITNSPLKAKKKSVNVLIGSPEKTIGWEKPGWTKTELRLTGKDLRKGVDLQAPITHVKKERMDDINFEANPLVLKPTKKGTDVRLGENLAKPITHCAKDPMADVNFVAIPELILKPTELGEKIKLRGNLEAPITHVEKDTMDDINFEANPLVLKSTEKGLAVRLGENLARPITFINGKTPSEGEG